jgi:hypothetical protein
MVLRAMTPTQFAQSPLQYPSQYDHWDVDHWVRNDHPYGGADQITDEMARYWVTVEMNFPVDVFLNYDPLEIPGTPLGPALTTPPPTHVFFPAGINPVPVILKAHPWLVANGVTEV